MNKRQERQYRLKMRRTYVFLGFCLLTALGLFIYQAHRENRVLMLKKRQERIMAARKEEAKLVEKLKNGGRLPEQKVTPVYVGGDVRPDEFAKLGFKVVEKIVPLDNSVFYQNTDQGSKPNQNVSPGSEWDQKELVTIGDKETLKQYMIYRLTCCSELIAWMWGGKKSEPYNVACKVASSLGMPHLYNLNERLISSFEREEDVKNNGGTRLRLPIIYTDLARMLLLYQNTKDEKINYAGLCVEKTTVKKTTAEAQGPKTQMLTGAMVETYNSAQEMLKIAKEAATDEVKKMLKITKKAATAEAEWVDDKSMEAELNYRIALKLHDSLCSSLTYSNEMHAANNENLVVEAFLNKRATSRGYARAYMLLLTLAGIENRLVRGDYSPNGKKNSENSPKVPWEWNMVKIGNEWVHIDVAADDQAILPAASFNQSEVERRMAELPSHSYFAMGKEEISRTHTWENVKSSEQQAVEPSEQQSEEKNKWYFFRHESREFDGIDNETVLLNVLVSLQRGEIQEYCLGERANEILNKLRQEIANLHEELSIVASEPDINGVVMIYILHKNKSTNNVTP